MSFGFGLGDILTVSQFAIQLYESCNGAPAQFSELRDQVKAVSSVLQAVNGYLTSRQAGPEQVAELGLIVLGFRPALLELNTLIAKRRKLESGKVQLWQRLRWPANQKLIDLRSRLSLQLDILQSRLIMFTTESVHVPQQIGWHMFPLKDLARVIIPPFFLPYTSSPNSSYQDETTKIRRSLCSCKIRFDWDVMRLRTRLGQSSASIDLDLDLGTSKALADFQSTFRDARSFRHGLLQIVAMYMRAQPQLSSTLQKATKIVILSHLVSHMPTKIRFETNGLTCTSEESEHIILFLKDQMAAMLQGLMFYTLTRLLQELENLCRLANPANWPLIYLSFCTLLFAAETMAIDTSMREPGEAAMCSIRQMEEQVIFYVLGHLEFSTRRRNPLDLDWKLSKNLALVGNDSGAIYALHRLQRFRHLHESYIEQQSTSSINSGGNASMTGRLVSKILV